MRGQIFLAIAIVVAGIAGYFEAELRTVGKQALHTIHGESPAGETFIPEPGSEVAATGEAPNPDIISTSEPEPKPGIDNALRSLRGSPAEGSHDQRTEYLQRLNSESGVPPGPLPAVQPPSLSASLPADVREFVPPPPGADLAVPEEPTDEEVDSFDMDADVFEPGDDLPEDFPPDGDLPPDDALEDGV